jgi:murein tripeptide amidase MpaA
LAALRRKRSLAGAGLRDCGTGQLPCGGHEAIRAHGLDCRTFPYTTRDLSAFLAEIVPNPAVRIDTLGLSPVYRKPLQRITIADPGASGPRKTVWIHARTHAAETGPSFVLEGLIRTVLADDALGQALRARYVFRIVPMHNLMA